MFSAMLPTLRRVQQVGSRKVSAEEFDKRFKGRKPSITAEDAKLADQHCIDYLRNTSIHGLKYLGEARRPIAERLFWAASFLLSIWACTLLVLKVWDKWENAPVIVTFAESTTPVWQFPFPAVTVCSETKVRQTKFNFTHAIMETENLTESELYNLERISLVCENQYVQGSNTTDESVLDYLADVAPPFSEMLWWARYQDQNINVSTQFSPVLTDEGICYTFNMLNAKEIFTPIGYREDYPYLNHSVQSGGWTLEHGYSKIKDLDTYPRRALGSGSKAGLTILLRSYQYDLDILCKGPVYGYKILLHNPGEIPRVGSKYFRLSLNQEMVLSVKPNMMTTSEGLRDYKPHRRKCYFPSERSLMFFRVYSQNNCDYECLTNFTYNYCGCVAFYMPRTNDMPICGSGKKLCMTKAVGKMVGGEIAEVSASGRSHCDCLPECSGLHYDAETSNGDFDGLSMMRAYKINTSSEEFHEINIGRVNIFVRDNQFITNRRSELYGLTDFLANCGGLLGLCMGFSILSLVEIIYYFTMRIFCNVMKKRRGRKSSPNRAVELDGEKPSTPTVSTEEFVGGKPMEKF